VPNSASVCAGRMQAIASILAEPCRSAIGSSLNQPVFYDHQTLVSNRIFRGERSRE
jgi:hypothetical protein